MLYLPDTGATMLGDFCVVKDDKNDKQN